MEYVGAITVLVLTLVLWVLSHKYFRFIYFGNIGNAILKEILECFFISLLLVSVFGGVLKTALSWIGTVLLFVLKAVLVIVGIGLAIALIAVIVKAILSKKGEKKDLPTCSPENTAEQIEPDSREEDQPCEVATAEADQTDIAAYIKENFSASDYLQAIKYYREKTGADPETAKAAVDDILKWSESSNEMC